MVQICRI